MQQNTVSRTKSSQRELALNRQSGNNSRNRRDKIFRRLRLALVFSMVVMLTLSLFAGFSSVAEPTIILEHVDLKIADHSNEKIDTVYPGVGPYQFRADIKMNDDSYLLETVALILDPGGVDISVKWESAGDVFSVTKDPQNYLTLHEDSSRSDFNGIDTWTLVFGLEMNWNFPEMATANCRLESELSNSDKYSDLFQGVFSYENDCEFSGDLILKDSSGNVIEKNGWVPAFEELSITGPVLVFEKSRSQGRAIYPDLPDSSYKLIDEAGGNFWLRPVTGGQELQMEAFSGTVSAPNTVYTLSIDNLPAGVELLTSLSISINIDGEPLIFFDEYPEESENYFKNASVYSGIYIRDNGGSGVDTESIEYAISIHGPMNYGAWTSVPTTDILGQSDGTVRASATPVFTDGIENYIKWHAKDLAGNGDTGGYFESDGTNIKIDQGSTANYPPIIILDQPKDNSVYTENEQITFSAHDSFDPDGDELSYVWSSETAGVLSNEAFFQKRLPPGEHQITIDIEDSYGHSSSRTMEISVEPDAVDSVSDLDEDEGGILILEPSGATAGTATAILVGTLYFFGGTEVGKYKLLGAVIPLYSKLTKRMVLDHETRGMIRGYIIANPGDHFTSIKKQIGLKNGTLAYHLKILERESIIKSHRDGIFKRFYPMNVKISSNLVHMSKQEQILNTIIENPGVTRKDLALIVGLSRQVINYHAKGLIQSGLVRSEKFGKKIQYYSNEPIQEEIMT